MKPASHSNNPAYSQPEGSPGSTSRLLTQLALPEVSYSTVDAMLDSKLVTHPSHQKDTITSSLTRAALQSPEVLENLAALMPGNLVLVMGDVNNMGPPNKTFTGHGARTLRAEVNDYLRHLAPAACAAFGDGMMKANLGAVPVQVIYREQQSPQAKVPAALLFRIGGDEFGLIVHASALHDDVHVISAMRAFSENMRMCRDKLFSQNDPLVQRVNEFAQLRTAMRRISYEAVQQAQLLDRGNRFSMESYLKCLHRFGSESLGKTRTDALLERGSGFVLLALAKQAVETRVADGSSEHHIMDISLAAVKLGSAPNVYTVTRALAAADKQIHHQKNSGTTELAIHEIEKDITVRQSEHDALITSAKNESRFTDAQQRLKGRSVPDAATLQHAFIQSACADPACPGVIRYNLIRDFSAREVLHQQNSTPRIALEFDVTAFGAINNQLGSERGDAIFKRITEPIRAMFPNEILVRHNGGGILLLLDSEAYPHLISPKTTNLHLKELREQLCNSLTHDLADSPRVRIDYELRNALAHERGDAAENARPFGSVSLSHGVVPLEANHHMASVVERATAGLQEVR